MVLDLLILSKQSKARENSLTSWHKNEVLSKSLAKGQINKKKITDWAFPEKNRNPPIEDIDFSSFRAPWISNIKKGNPLDIKTINFLLTPGYPWIKGFTPWISLMLLL